MPASKKAMAVHTIVLVIMMAFFAIVAFLILYQWTNYTNLEANRTSCAFKKVAYCTDWKANNYKSEPWNWGDKAPKSCDEFGITKPTASSDCESLLK
jgi:hypothetical protein